jgi:hypothetical protein
MPARGELIVWADFSSQEIRPREKIVSVISESSSNQREWARDPFFCLDNTCEIWDNVAQLERGKLVRSAHNWNVGILGSGKMGYWENHC